MKTNRPLSTSTSFLHLKGVFLASLVLAAVFSAQAVSDAALQRFYDNEMKTAAGRARWHGNLVSTTIDTNTFSRVTRYEDGTTFTDRASTPLDRVQAANRRLAARTNGVPARLAAARARLAREASQTNTVTRTIKAGQ